MRARFINEIKRNQEGTGLSAIGIGKARYLKGYYMIKKIDPKFATDRTLQTVIDEFSDNDEYFKSNGVNDYLGIVENETIEKFINVVESVTESNLSDLAIVSSIEMGKYRSGIFDGLFSKSNDAVTVMIPGIHGRIFGDNYNYQVLYNDDLKMGYVELYPLAVPVDDSTYGGKSGPSLFNYFVKYN